MVYYPPDHRGNQRGRNFPSEARKRSVPPRRQQVRPMQGQAYGYGEFAPPSQARVHQHGQQYLYENQQHHIPPQHMPRRRFPEKLNHFMDHADKVSEGINIMRQIGAFFNMFK